MEDSEDVVKIHDSGSIWQFFVHATQNKAASAFGSSFLEPGFHQANRMAKHLEFSSEKEEIQDTTWWNQCLLD